ncbi:hypothetical protein J2T57_004437 [Natronocella acetinitrilica]|uniref:Transposase n=1 Tax=Natronocella acetinitrilica TaxID=414046 RepID=A0AAE3G910_9GAMM|nr:hypothetical protein [Natronocella acetinitrilica]
MRKSRFSEEKVVRILRETDASPVSEVAKQVKHTSSADCLDRQRVIYRDAGLMPHQTLALYAAPTSGYVKREDACKTFRRGSHLPNEPA